MPGTGETLLIRLSAGNGSYFFPQRRRWWRWCSDSCMWSRNLQNLELRLTQFSFKWEVTHSLHFFYGYLLTRPELDTWYRDEVHFQSSVLTQVYVNLSRNLSLSDFGFRSLTSGVSTLENCGFKVGRFSFSLESISEPRRDFSHSWLLLTTSLSGLDNKTVEHRCWKRSIYLNSQIEHCFYGINLQCYQSWQIIFPGFCLHINCR